MESTQEREDFSQWHDRRMDPGDAERTQAYGRRIIVNARGRRKKLCYRAGTVVLGDDGLAFLRKVIGIPSWAVLLIIAAGLVTVFVATIFFCALTNFLGGGSGTGSIGVLGGAGGALAAGGVIAAAARWGRRPSNLRDVARLQKSIADPASMFIPLSCITGVETCSTSGWGNPDHISILFRRDSESPQEELILGDLAGASIGFDAPEFRHKLEKLLAS